MKKARFLRAGYFVWLAVPFVFFVFAQGVGLPHLLWSYDWQAYDSGRYADLSRNHHTRCTYIGPRGAFTESPVNSRCDWLRFIRKAGDR